ncbi:NAD-dependent epimerase/dehydratase family protein [Streptomyces sp. NPDC090029]|uniref:NAD-dependent epimerase/dehydratase family protein n=1 Tax=Streptomyces sp. NPDC090029 TaxID=3365924 RepID=UPI003806922A
MRILIVGGSVFLGRAFVAEALRRGHEVTVFNRGKSGADSAGVEIVRGNRQSAEDLDRLAGNRTWDVVVDTCGFEPQVVAQSAKALSGHAGTYLFVSSCHAYAGWPGEPVDEKSPRHPCAPDAAPDDVVYNALKAGCERAVELSFEGRTLILGPGLIVGPHENTGRLLWWLERFARGGRVLVPGSPDRPVRLVDARDIAVFGLDRAEAGDSNRYLVTGRGGEGHDGDVDTLGDLFAHCAEVTGSDAEPVWVDDDFLLEHEVAVWTGLPFWAADVPALAGTWRASSAKAEAAGLRLRPLPDTVRDTWEWLRARGLSDGPYRQGDTLLGITPDRERELLAAWDARQQGGAA